LPDVTLSTYTTIDAGFHEGVVDLILNTPDAGNPVGAVFCREFGEAASEVSNLAGVRVVHLQARGKHFSVGGDVRMFADDIDNAPAAVRNGTFGLHMGIQRLIRMDAPIVATVHATAMGGAVALVANCDLVFAGESAIFGAAYARLGFSCDMGATFGLASRMGVARARRFLLLAEVLGAADALTAGLADFVLPDDELVAASSAAVAALRDGPTRAYGEVRRLMARSLGTPFETQLEDEAQALARVAGSADAREGLTAFVERRVPIFHGN
jgi:2-(1,2-epoxy-1,2-dihydrophenyl)acetyl-CoA isomerase